MRPSLAQACFIGLTEKKNIKDFEDIYYEEVINTTQVSISVKEADATVAGLYKPK